MFVTSLLSATVHVTRKAHIRADGRAVEALDYYGSIMSVHENGAICVLDRATDELRIVNIDPMFGDEVRVLKVNP
jgi:hypothetical protein